MPGMCRVDEHMAARCRDRRQLGGLLLRSRGAPAASGALLRLRHHGVRGQPERAPGGSCPARWRGLAHGIRPCLRQLRADCSVAAPQRVLHRAGAIAGVRRGAAVEDLRVDALHAGSGLPLPFREGRRGNALAAALQGVNIPPRPHPLLCRMRSPGRHGTHALGGGHLARDPHDDPLAYAAKLAADGTPARSALDGHTVVSNPSSAPWFGGRVTCLLRAPRVP
mmetsp:Transcript_80255/g.238994  ORF Transcript_80255/g.238994 Transcript_80255/m.238994 type:complete len:223 (-) Transcript_80255:595-1263(-)